MKEKIWELIKTIPLPWDYFIYLVNLRKMIYIHDNLNIINFLKIWIGFISTMPVLNYVIPFFVDFNIVEAVNPYQFFLFLLYETFFISIFYSLIVYGILFFQGIKNAKNVIAIYMQSIKFYTIAIIFIFSILALLSDSLIQGNEDFLENIESLTVSKYLIQIIIGTLVILGFFYYIIIHATVYFFEQQYTKTKHHMLLTLFSILCSYGITFFVGKLDVFPIFPIKNLIYVDKFCREASEVPKFQNMMKKSNTSIFDFREECENKINENLLRF